jgi:hypothetical protein
MYEIKYECQGCFHSIILVFDEVPFYPPNNVRCNSCMTHMAIYEIVIKQDEKE